jgi:hypothetical protein
VTDYTCPPICRRCYRCHRGEYPPEPGLASDDGRTYPAGMARRPIRDGRDAHIDIRVHDHERELLDQAAAVSGASTSVWARMVLLAAAKRATKSAQNGGVGEIDTGR